MKTLRAMGSLRLTLVGMGWLLLAILIAYLGDRPLAGWMVAPLGLLCVNLVCALASNPRFRVHQGLLVFHICLLAVLVLAVLGLLARFEARVMLTEGQRLVDAAVEVRDAGPLHPGGLEALEIVQGPLRVEYGAGLRMGGMSSRIALHRGGGVRELRLERNKSLVLDGFRFTPTSNKGIALLLAWEDEQGRSISGAVNFPSYPLLAWQQEMDWTTPAGQALHLALDLPPVPDNEAWVLSSEVLRGSLRVQADGGMHVLVPGQSLVLGGGTLHFEAFRMWMGYRVEYAPLVPWVIASALIAILGLAAHFYSSLFRVQQRGGAPLPLGQARTGA